MSTKRVTRTTTGCHTCRIRRIKCDEEKPACKKCTSTGRRCDGYANGVLIPRKRVSPVRRIHAETSPQRTPSPRSLLPLPYSSNEDKESYGKFVYSATMTSRRMTVPGFWNLVLQMASTESSIRHIVLALGSSYHKHGSDILRRAASESFMLKHYGDAIQETRKMICEATQPKEISIALVACVLFIYFEALMGNFDAAYLHVQRGLKIAMALPTQRQISQQQAESNFFNGELRLVTDALARVDMQLMVYSGDNNPYPFDVNLAPKTTELEEFEKFEDIEHAVRVAVRNWRCIFHICDWTYRRFYGQKSAPYEAENIATLKELCHDRLFDTGRALQQLRAATFARPDLDQRLRDIMCLLQIWHELSSMMLDGADSVQELQWDKYLSDFERILALISELEKSSQSSKEGLNSAAKFEIGTIPSLFLIGARCRDPKIRRQAASILRSMDRWEGWWPSWGSAQVVDKIIEFEEREVIASGNTVVSAKDIPEEARVNAVHIIMSFNSTTAAIAFVSRLGHPDGSLYTEAGIVEI